MLGLVRLGEGGPTIRTRLGGVTPWVGAKNLYLGNFLSILR